MKDEELDLALEALEGVVKNCWRDMPSWRLDEIKERITAIKQARSAPAQEPVAHCTVRPLRGDESYPKTEIIWVKGKPIAGPLYTTPPAAQRQWVGLTDEDRAQCVQATHELEKRGNANELMAAVEAKLKEKNT